MELARICFMSRNLKRIFKGHILAACSCVLLLVVGWCFLVGFFCCFCETGFLNDLNLLIASNSQAIRRYHVKS